MNIARREFLGGMVAASVPRAAARATRVGCQTRVYGVPIKDPTRLLAVLDDLRDTGYEGFETNYASLEAAFDNPAPLRAEFAKRGVPLIGLHVGARFMQAGTLEKERALVERVARAVKAFGGTHVMLSGSAVPKGQDGKLEAGALRMKTAELNRAGKVCRDLGVTIASHNHIHEADNSGEELTAVLAETDPKLVGLLLDIGAAHLAHLDTPAFIRRHGGRIAGFHVRDYQGEKEARMGEGQVDMRGFGRAVHETGWSGWVILEMNLMKTTASRDLVDGARKYMRKELNI